MMDLLRKFEEDSLERDEEEGEGEGGEREAEAEELEDKLSGIYLGRSHAHQNPTRLFRLC